MLPYLQKSLYQVLTLSSGSNNGDSIRDEATDSAEVTADDPIEPKPIETEVTVTVTESEAVTEKLFTVDSPNETSSSGGTENDFEIVSNESSPIASPTTIMAEHDGSLDFGLGEEVEDTDKFTKTLNNPKGVSEMELREKRQRLR